MKLLQFSTRDMTWGVTLIGVGLGCLSGVWRLLGPDVEFTSTSNVLCASVIVNAAVALILAGILAPLRAKRIGAVLGALVGLPVLAIGVFWLLLTIQIRAIFHGMVP